MEWATSLLLFCLSRGKLLHPTHRAHILPPLTEMDALPQGQVAALALGCAGDLMKRFADAGPHSPHARVFLHLSQAKALAYLPTNVKSDISKSSHTGQARITSTQLSKPEAANRHEQLSLNRLASSSAPAASQFRQPPAHWVVVSSHHPSQPLNFLRSA